MFEITQVPFDQPSNGWGVSADMAIAIAVACGVSDTVHLALNKADGKRRNSQTSCACTAFIRSLNPSSPFAGGAARSPASPPTVTSAKLILRPSNFSLSSHRACDSDPLPSPRPAPVKTVVY
ncbi:hypothetical protein PG985_005670 [Apiospora marii]|uniref:uncharacterized protein n=1 Tax=Apiospora marii TaxID=335849 RepID=UPI00313033F9